VPFRQHVAATGGAAPPDSQRTARSAALARFVPFARGVRRIDPERRSGGEDEVTAHERTRRGATAASAVRQLLVVSPDGTDRDGLLHELAARADLPVRRARSAAAAEALQDGAVVLLVAAPELPTAAVTELLASRERTRPALPVLVVRDRNAEEPASWARRGVGVLRLPIVRGALARSVDVVLGLRDP
jgi:hypothetical protein